MHVHPGVGGGSRGCGKHSISLRLPWVTEGERVEVEGGGGLGLLGQCSTAFHTREDTGCSLIIKYTKYLEVTHLRQCVCVVCVFFFFSEMILHTLRLENTTSFNCAW